MKKLVLSAVAAQFLLHSGPALCQDNAAEDLPAVTISGGATLVSDYRFRGISQTNEKPALQGNFTLSHSSGFYVSTWGSSVSDYVADNSQEIDLIGGYKHDFNGTILDVGATYYYYPNSGLPFSDFIEPYASLSHTLGPVSAKIGVAYAPKQMALSVDGVTEADNLYLSGDLSAGVPGTPISVAAHIGRNFEPSYITFGDKYTDWSLGASYTWNNLVAGVSYVDTDKNLVGGGNIQSDAGVVVSVGVAF